MATADSRAIRIACRFFHQCIMHVLLENKVRARVTVAHEIDRRIAIAVVRRGPGR